MMRFAICLLAILLPATVWAEGYRVGLNDRLSIQIAVWDELNATVTDMPGVSGEYPVGANGEVSIPLAGSLEALDRTPQEIATAIEAAMTSYVGIGQTAKAAVSVFTYAPIYVSGQVEKPGVYPFTPGLTVRMALSLAGGGMPLGPIEGQERNFLTARGTIKVLERELTFLTAKRERLLLEMDGGDETTERADIDPEAWASETAILEARNTLYDNELDALARARTSLEQAETVLKSKFDTNQAQLEAGKSELRREEDLVERGLTAPIRIFERATYVNELESRLLDIERSVLLAQQEMQELERNKGLLMAQRNEDNATMLQEVEAKIAEIDAQIVSQFELMSAAAGQQVGELEFVDPSTAIESYEITRIRGESATFDAEKSTVLQPGDVLDVTFNDPATLTPSN